MEQPELRATPSGHVSLFYRGEFLDDKSDPVGAAQAFVEPARLDDAKLVVLFGTGLGYRMATIRDTGARVVVYEPSKAIFSLVSEQLPAALEGVEAFTERPALQERLLQSTMAGQKTVLLVPPAYKRAFPEEHAALVSTMQEAESLKQLRMNTLKERFGLILETALRNLPRLEGIPMFTALDKPLAGTPAFVVSAGPSLDCNGEFLAEAARKGAVFTVNTAAPAVLHHQGAIDVVTCVEALDVTQSLAPTVKNAKALAIDLSAAAENLAMDTPHKLAFMPSSDPFHDLARDLGTRPLSYGASVATAAYALARDLGADPIVLLGQDLAYTGGQVYATGTGREHMRAELIQPNAFEITYDEHMLETFRKKGIPTPKKHRPAVEVAAWGGGTTHTTHDMVLFHRWFEAAALKTEARRVNATEGGARLAGFEEMKLKDLLQQLPTRSDNLAASLAVPGLEAPQIDAVRKNIAKHAREVARAAERCLKARTAKHQRKTDAALQQAKRHSKYVDLHATPTLLRVRENKSLSPRERRNATFEAIRDSGNRVAALVS